MLSALSHIKAHRVWFVPKFNVWGTPGSEDIDYLVVETVDSVNGVLFGRAALGDDSQPVKFEDLTDFRGNTLPSTILNPRVLVRQKSDYTAHIVGDEFPTGFHIARQADATGPVTVDLLIVEMGD
ncbi:MAG: hypothetical protein JSW34_09805 [Candidatus Zixiibacteriota bacterium]|nr:MAG: hypothetical protein JSW34_09805 [candidate division Zixibacteria bacterium]